MAHQPQTTMLTSCAWGLVDGGKEGGDMKKSKFEHQEDALMDLIQAMEKLAPAEKGKKKKKKPMVVEVISIEGKPK